MAYNVNITGTLTNNNGVLSGFSSSNYATVNSSFSPGVDNWTIKLCFTTGNDTNSDQFILGQLSNTTESVILAIQSQDLIIALRGESGSEIESWSSFESISTETKYYLRINYDSNSGYSIDISTDNTSWSTVYTNSSTDTIGDPSDLILGNHGNCNSPFLGSIDLNYCSITINNVITWQGVTQSYNGVHIQLRRDTASNWSTANPVLYSGEVGLITDQSKYVVGDGSTAYNSLTKHNMDTDITGCANTNLSNLTATGEKHFLNKTQVTNCILEAPNGTLTYSGSTLTAHQGMKVLIPNGRNTDGTLNNIEYILSSDITFTYNYNTQINNDTVFINSNGYINRLQSEYVFYLTRYSELATRTGSNQYRIAYVEQDNKWYYTGNTGSTWDEKTICPLGHCFINSSNTIIFGLEYQQSKLLTTSDTDYISKVASISNAYIGLTLGATGTRYIAPADGWFAVSGGQNDWNGFIFLWNIDAGLTGFSQPTSTNDFAIRAYIPVSKGQTVQVDYGSIYVSMFRFVYNSGSVGGY